jgi:hypothetical protein
MMKRDFKQNFKESLINGPYGPIIHWKFGTDDSNIPKIVSEVVSLAQSCEKHKDWDKMAQHFPGRIPGIAATEKPIRHHFELRCGDPYFGSFDEKYITGHIDAVGTDMRDGKPRTARYGNTIIILDYKPSYKFNPGDEFSKDFFETYTQLIAYGLREGEASGLNVLCVPYNEEGADIFEPERMLLELEAFLFGYTEPHSKEMDDKMEGWMPTKELKGYFMSLIEKVDKQTLIDFIHANIKQKEFVEIREQYQVRPDLDPVQTAYGEYGLFTGKKSLKNLESKWSKMELILLIELFFDLEFHITTY